MKDSKFLKKIGINESDFTLIAQAVQEAERCTDGEITLAVTKQSDDYSLYELLAGMSISVVTFIIAIVCSSLIADWLNTLLWYPAVWCLPAAIGAIIFFTTGLFFLVANIPAVDRFIIPTKVKHAKVYHRMLIHFAESGVYKTKHHCGILIFISVLERTVMVLGDEGINAKITAKQWQHICNSLVSGIKERQTGIALCKAIQECGRILAEHFPAQKENLNELPDGLTVV